VGTSCSDSARAVADSRARLHGVENPAREDVKKIWLALSIAAAIKREQHLDGKWLLRTSDVTLTPNNLAAAYKQAAASRTRRARHEWRPRAAPGVPHSVGRAKGNAGPQHVAWAHDRPRNW